MSLVTTVANVAADSDARLVPEAATRHTFIESRSSRELYEEYARKYPEKLEQYGITSYKRAPNGQGDFAGVWVPPFPIDIWDYWINYRFVNANTREYISWNDYRYIPNPAETSIASQINRPAEGRPVYNEQLSYLWDFVYNPEVVLSRFSSEVAAFTRRRPFPYYLDDSGKRSDDGDIMPAYLPDACFPHDFAEIYPWAAWEEAVEMNSAQIQGDVYVPLVATRAQRQTFMRAHGGNKSTKKTDASAYAFTPHEDNDVLSKVVRPLYPIERATLYRGYFAVPYSPLVLRDLHPFKSNGWLFCYRQAVRYSSDIYFPKSKLWGAFKEANRLLHSTPGMSVDYAVATALPKQRQTIWPRLDLSTLDIGAILAIPADKENTTAAADMRLLRDITHRGRTVQDVYELATRASGVVMESVPYRIITVQVYESKPPERYAVDFGAQVSWVLSIPPLLSITAPATLEYFSTDATIVWHAGSDEQQLAIMFDGQDVASSHQIRVTAAVEGESLVEAKITRALRTTGEPIGVRYVFKLAWLQLVVSVRDFDHGDAGKSLKAGKMLVSTLNDDAPYVWRQQAESFLYAHANRRELAERHIVNTWPLFSMGRNDQVTRRADFAISVDFARPVILVRDVTNKGYLYLFVLRLKPVLMLVSRFGERVRLAVTYDSLRNGIVWTRPKGATSSDLVVTVVSPRQLGEYRAEVRALGRVGLPDYVVPFLIEFDWRLPIPFDYIQRSAPGNWHYDNPAVLRKPYRIDSMGVQMVYDLREVYDGPFYLATVAAWARKYYIDVENYASCFSVLLSYCKHMDELAESTGAAIVTELVPELRQFLPAHLSEPLLELPLKAENSDSPYSPYSYVVFDALTGEWINILAPLHKRINADWTTTGTENLRARIKALFPLVSIEFEEREQQASQDVPPAWLRVKQRHDDVRRGIEELRALRVNFAQEIAKLESDFLAQTNAAQKELQTWYAVHLTQELAIDPAASYDSALDELRAYARFVSAVLCECIRYDSGDYVVPAIEMLQSILRRSGNYPPVWQSIRETFELQTYGAFMSTTIAAPDDSTSLLEQMRADNYPLDSWYVLFKFLYFVCEHRMVPVEEQTRNELMDVCAAGIANLNLEKIPILSENY